MVLVVEYEVSLTVDGEDSGGIIERIVSVCNPHNGFFGNVIIPNSNVAAVGISGAEKTKCKGFLV